MKELMKNISKSEVLTLRDQVLCQPGWYELYQSVVRAVPNCGRSRTKVRYKAYQPLVFPVPNAGIILVFIYY